MMILQIDIVGLRRAIKEKCDEIFSDKKLVEEFYRKMCEIENDERFVVLERDDCVSEWVEDSDPGQEYGTTWACIKCFHSIHKPFIWNPYNSKMRYCPNCGRRMVVNMDATD